MRPGEGLMLRVNQIDLIGQERVDERSFLSCYSGIKNRAPSAAERSPSLSLSDIVIYYLLAYWLVLFQGGLLVFTFPVGLEPHSHRERFRCHLLYY
uniref:Uncharacterized protein n=1 Tax=Utricularia reniformis TaxID=192314 RepID=A0A1Y0B1U0_9LAMI|nr:hypothetical protein AEK19_MT1202 [Utricularia reniformis]ART31416.1 hypothetical protein AEK19_MT1202 [Utricularia reniformis]